MGEHGLGRLRNTKSKRAFDKELAIPSLIVVATAPVGLIDIARNPGNKSEIRHNLASLG